MSKAQNTYSREKKKKNNNKIIIHETIKITLHLREILEKMV